MTVVFVLSFATLSMNQSFHEQASAGLWVWLYTESDIARGPRSFAGLRSRQVGIGHDTPTVKHATE